MEEVWRHVHGFSGQYSVSNLGKVRSNVYIKAKNGKNLFPGKILNPSRIQGKSRYHRLGLTNYLNNTRKSYNVHRLVAETFIKNPYNLPYVNHKSGDRSDNSVDNLEWCTSKYNAIHAHNMGLIKVSRGDKRSDAKYTESFAGKILELYFYDLLTYEEISQIVGVMKEYVALIVQGKRWVGVYEEFLNKHPKYVLESKKMLAKRRKSNRQRVEESVYELQKILA